MAIPTPPNRLDRKITCLCPTYGRLTRLRQSLACFLSQDSGDKAKLLIYNFHDQPIRLLEDYPNVELVNHPHQGDVHEMWEDLLEVVDTPFIHPWYDDDIYLPWAVSQGLNHIGPSQAFKPRFFFTMHGELGKHSMGKTENVGEGSMTLLTRHALRIRLQESDALWTPELHVVDVCPSWLFRWADGVCKSEGIPRDIPRKERDKIWRSRNQDVGDCLLYPTSVLPYWRAVAEYSHEAAVLLEGYINGAVEQMRQVPDDGRAQSEHDAHLPGMQWGGSEGGGGGGALGGALGLGEDRGAAQEGDSA